MRKRRPKRTVPHTTALSPLAVPSILTRTQEKVLKKRMKRQVETSAKTPTHGLKHKSSAFELSTYSTPDQVRNTVSCMTQFVPATSPPQCDISFLREKQPSAVHNDKFYAVAGYGKIPPGIVIQDISESLTVHSLPPTHHLYVGSEFSSDALNITIPEGVHTLRLEGNNLATVEALPVRHLTQLKRLYELVGVDGNSRDIRRIFLPCCRELRSNPRITALTKASGDALPANLTSLYAPSKSTPFHAHSVSLSRDFTLCNIRHIDADFMLPPALTTLKLRNNKLSSILNLTLPATLQTLTLEGNVLTDARITQRNFDILVKCTRVSATVPAPECKGSEVQRMTPFKFELCVLPDTAQVLAAPLPKKSFVTSILPILGSALGGTVLLTAIFVFRFRRRANCRPKAMNQTLHDCPLERTAADGSTSPENDEHGSSPSSSAYSEGEERVGSDRSGNLCPRLHLQRCSDAPHSLNSRKKTGPSKTKLDLSSERQELLQTHYVFGFAPDQAKTQNALKAIAKSTKTAGKAKKGATKKGQKSKARKESLRRDAPTNGSPSIGAFKCGATAVLTMCNSASGTSEVCILSEKDGKCEPQYITALPNGNPSGSRFITIEDIKEVLDIAVIPASFETVYVVSPSSTAL
ncbi:hypothetical protein DYB32_002320 [Aphanomyces invadans]|uniref:Uncharacterized protein n=1 Tax=Aphanomyces invadans TaxID=157072 RepID=A0A418B483_9STRA|nr:hypothetical protein DYB32_002320 [Aphanomyces invadans]